MLDNDGAGLGGGVMDQILDLTDVKRGLLEYALADGDTVNAFGVVRVVGGDANGFIDGVGEQPLFCGMYRIEQAFAAEVAVFHDRE